MIDQRKQPVDAAHAHAVVAEYCERNGMECPATFTPTEAAELLSGLDYSVTPGVIAEFVRKRYVSFTNPNQLTPVDLYVLTAALESRRRWTATPSQHDPKKSSARLICEQLREQGIENPIQDAERFSLEDLLLFLASTDDRPTRECLYEAVKQKLDGFEE